MIKKNNIGELDTSIDEGQLLIMALAHITTTTRTDKTPDEVLMELVEKADQIYSKEGTN